MIVFASRNYRFFGYDFKPSMLAQTPNYIIIFHHKIMRIEAVYFIKKRFGDVQRLIATAKNEERIARQSAAKIQLEWHNLTTEISFANQNNLCD